MPELADYAEFKDVMDAATADEMYPTLMSKEKAVLDTVDGLVKYYSETTEKKSRLWEYSFRDLVSKVLQIVSDTYDALLAVRSADDVKLWWRTVGPDHFAVAGFALIFLAIVVFLAT